MDPVTVILFIVGYFALLMLISHFTSKGATNDAFFIGANKSKWYLVAFGMIGASLSGVTFISVPGWVGSSQFSYMQMVMGYFVGYTVIALVLMPLYYRLKLTSIYTYLEERFGYYSYKTGAGFFLLSRTIGAAFRLFLVAQVLQYLVFDKIYLTDEMTVPFWVTVMITILLIWLYTFKGGIKTIVWTDSLQTLFMLIAVGVSIYFIASEMNLGFSELISEVKNSDYSQVFFFDDWKDKKHFIKQFFSGMFLAIVMTGLDQDMMQKNLSCANIKDGQKNMFSFSFVLIIVNFVFLVLGALLYIYANKNGIAIPEKTDNLFPEIAAQHLNSAAGIFFILGLVAAAYSSADSALTALTTSVCVDFLDINNKKESLKIKLRKKVHIIVSIVLFGVILLFNIINDESVISSLFKAAGYTYGPLLGLYAFGLFLKRKVRDYLVPLICLLSPVICYLLNIYSTTLFNGYQFGFEILILNGALTFLGLFLSSLFLEEKRP
ncbi:MAG: sodium:solute symporter [Flavobacteriales bacterium]|nr:MAG: sodium:solute symporter [Flavobacteriales bacterium]